MYQSVCLWNHISSFLQLFGTQTYPCCFRRSSPPSPSFPLAMSSPPSLCPPSSPSSSSRVSRVCAFFIVCPTLLRTSQARRAIGPLAPAWDEAILILSGLTAKLVVFSTRTEAAEWGQSDTLTSIHTGTWGQELNAAVQPHISQRAPRLQRHSECILSVHATFRQSVITLGYIFARISRSLRGGFAAFSSFFFVFFFALYIFPYLRCVSPLKHCCLRDVEVCPLLMLCLLLLSLGCKIAFFMLNIE